MSGSDTLDTPATHPAVILKTAQKSRGWVFTWNDYTNEDIEYLKTTLSTHQYLFGEEIAPSTGMKHLQGVVRFQNARSFDSVKKLLKKSHIELCKNWMASLNYCSKDGQTFTNIERKIKKEPLKNKLLKKYESITWKDWQKKIIDICETEPDDRKINWIYDPIGANGKSYLAKYIYLKYDAIIGDGKKQDVFNQILIWMEKNKEESPKIIVLDIPRHNMEYFNYGLIEKIKDGLIYSGKYEGGCCAFESPHIFIFSNEKPDLHKFTQDRWNVIQISEQTSHTHLLITSPTPVCYNLL